jgi:allophanate hydrolase subunit 1
MDMEKQLEQRLELIAKAIQRGESNEKAVVGQEFTEVTSDDVLPSSVLHEQAERGIVGEAGYLPRFLIRQAGDRGLLCEFGSQSFDLIPRVKIQQIVQYIWDKTPQGIRRVARPHTMSVLVSFDPDVLSQEQAVAKLVELEASLAGDASYQSKGRRFRLPMVFDAEENAVATKRYMDLQRPYATYLPDNIDFIRRNNGLDTRDDVLKAVEGVPFMVLGASGPMGLPVMIQLDPRHRLTVPKTNPSRNSTPAGALGTGGNTTAIYPFDA